MSALDTSTVATHVVGCGFTSSGSLPKKQREDSVTDDVQGSSVLVVDDSPEHLRLLGAILKRGGLVPRPVTSGRLALEAAAEDPPDLVLLDVLMPEMSGLEVCRQFKQDQRLRDVPVIFISALQGVDDKVEGFRAGGVDYVCKPFQEQEVLERIKTHLRLRRLQVDLMSRTAPYAHHSRHSVLVVDDDIQFLRILGEILSRDNLDVLTAQDAGQAVALLEKSLPCMIFLDVEMPGMDGLALCRRIRHHPRTAHVPVVLVSSRVDESDVKAGLVAGAADYIKKPFDMDEVRTRVRMQIRLHEAMIDQQRINKYLEVISAAASDAIIGIGHDDAIWHWNHAAERIFGYTCDEVIGRDLHALIAPSRSQGADGKASSPFRASAETAALTKSIELTATRKSGEEFPIELSLAPAEIDGQPCAVGIVRDITERKQVEDELRSAKAFLDSVINAIADPIFVKDENRRFVLVNNALCAMVGRPREGLMGEDGDDMFPKEQVAVFREKDAKVLETGEENVNEEFLSNLSSGEVRTIVTRKARYIDATGKRFLVGVIRDITDHTRLEIELGHARKLEAVGQLASGIAHEINTPTQYVGDGVHFLREAFAGYQRLVGQYRRAVEALVTAGGQETLVSEIRATEEDVDLSYLEANVPGSFESCQDGVSRISTIVRAMKEFAHPDQREMAPADLNKALQTTLAIAKNEYKYVSEVTTEFGDLPPVICHVGDLNQVFLNLIVNAAHAIGDVVGKSGGKGTIRIRTCSEGDVVRIDIADTGSGIPEAIRHRIFDPFFTTKGVGKGSGQGLAIARSIVATKHRGSLTFESEVGKGTTFTIRLPTGDSPGA
jgi:PAS domain S-box-containing protein